MARYIDVDKLNQKVNPWLDGGVLVIAVQSLNEAETADVVPKSELDEADEIIDMQQEVICNYRESVEELQGELEQLKSEAVKEIFWKIARKLPCDRDFNSQDIRLGYAWALAEVRRMLHEIKKEYNIDD